MQKSETLLGNCLPTAAEVDIRPSKGSLYLQNKVKFLKPTLSTSASLIPHTPCLTRDRNNSQALRQSLLTLASRSLLGSSSLPEWMSPPFPKNQSSHALWRTSEAFMHSLGVAGLTFVYGNMGPAILTLYWTNIYHLQLFFYFPKWTCSLWDEATACCSEMSLQDFLSNSCGRVR